VEGKKNFNACRQYCSRIPSIAGLRYHPMREGEEPVVSSLAPAVKRGSQSLLTASGITIGIGAAVGGSRLLAALLSGGRNRRHDLCWNHSGVTKQSLRRLRTFRFVAQPDPIR